MPWLNGDINVSLHRGKIGGTLLNDLGYASERYDLEVWVPRGFETDFASVPEFALDAIINPIGVIGPAAVVHDFLYASQGRVEEVNGGTVLTRKQCDEIFMDACIECGLGPARAWIAYLGVRAGGWKPWRDHGSTRQAV